LKRKKKHHGKSQKTFSQKTHSRANEPKCLYGTWLLLFKMKRLNIKINDRLKFEACRSQHQQCVYCGKEMGIGGIGVCMSNVTDELTMNKNLWIHIECLPKMARTVKYHFKKNQAELIAFAL
jgi:hypothetical protein